MDTDGPDEVATAAAANSRDKYGREIESKAAGLHNGQTWCRHAKKVKARVHRA